MNFKHMQYEFPLDNNIQLNILPTSLHVLFKIKHITLPVFQRRYCWRNSQLRLFWKDLNDIALCYDYRGNHKHSIGKVTLFEKSKDSIIVIDGQQRITTTLIILISMRNEFQRYNNIHKNPNVETLIHAIHSILFNNIPNTSILNKKRKKNDDIESKHNNKSYIDVKKFQYYKESIQEGERIRCIRFLPTYLDRKPLYNLIYNNGEYEKYVSSKHKNKEINISYIYECKRFFDVLVQRCKNMNMLKRLLHKLLTQFTFIYVGIPNNCWDKSHCLYQWLFEKDLLADTLLKNDRPGEYHQSSELFKNYILSFFMSFPMKKQEQVYVKWINIEKSFVSTKHFNDYLIKAINSQNSEPYDVYQDLVKVIEKKLKDRQESEYTEIIELFLNSLATGVDADEEKNNDDD